MATEHQHWRAFDEPWFRRHQSVLLWFLNGPLRRLSRRLLRIEETRDLCQIAPNRYVVHLGGEQYQATFRTHPKYSKRLYYALRPLWWALHAWDSILPARWEPALGFGFDTLTVYPNPAGGSTDGVVYRGSVMEHFEDLCVGAGTGADYWGDVQQIAILCHGANPWFAEIRRYIALFDTSGLGASASISAATLSLYGEAAAESPLGEDAIIVVSSNPASNDELTADDFGCLGSILFGSMWMSSWGLGYNNFTLNASGISAISKTGISKFGLRFDWDRTGVFGGTWRSILANTITFDASNASGTTKDPKLVVTFTSPPVAKSASDTASLSFTENRTNALGSTRGDSGTLSLAESTTSVGLHARSDSGTLSLTEATASALQSIRSDSGELSLVESSSSALNSALSESGTLGLLESSSVGQLVSLAAADSLGLSLAELSTLVSVLSASDSLGLSLDELAAIFGIVQAADALGVSLLQEWASIQGTVSCSDTLSIGIADAQSPLGLTALADSLGLPLQEAATLNAIVHLARADVLAVPILEAVRDLRQRSLPPPSEVGIRVVNWLRPAI